MIHDALLEFFAAVFLMVLVARLFGELARRTKLPSLIGEIFAGMLLGTTALNIIQPTSDLTTVTNISLFLIMFLTGLHLDSEEILKAGRRAMLISIPGFVLPLVLGSVVAFHYGLDLRESLAVGLTLSITAVPVNSIILMDLGILNTSLGTTVLTAGVIDDQVSLVMLGIILQLPANATSVAVNYGSLLLSIGEVLLFVGSVLVAATLLARHPAWVRLRLPKLNSKLIARESSLSLLLIFGIGVSLLAEAMGLHFIIGAYFAGIVAKQAIGDAGLTRDLDVLSGVTFAVFAPLLFAYIGIQLNPYALGGVLTLFLVLLLVGIAGKMVGGFAGASVGRFSTNDSLLVGALLNSRGMVELVIASLIYQEGLISLTIFTVVVAIGIITTTMSAVLSRAFVRTSPDQTLTVAETPSKTNPSGLGAQ